MIRRPPLTFSLGSNGCWEVPQRPLEPEFNYIVRLGKREEPECASKVIACYHRGIYIAPNAVLAPPRVPENILYEWGSFGYEPKGRQSSPPPVHLSVGSAVPAGHDLEGRTESGDSSLKC